MNDLAKFEIIDEAGWQRGLAKNKDAYGFACYRYASRWANFMERELANGKPLAEIAQATSHEADDEGITGYMYGVAVSLLAHCWKHGEELRRWHNLKTQIGNEGEQANASGGVLNPAIINLG